MCTTITNQIKQVISKSFSYLEGQWKKYQGHCYYFSPNIARWYEAEVNINNYHFKSILDRRMNENTSFT